MRTREKRESGPAGEAWLLERTGRDPCVGQLKLFLQGPEKQTQRRPTGHCVRAEPGCMQEEGVTSF